MSDGSYPGGALSITKPFEQHSTIGQKFSFVIATIGTAESPHVINAVRGGLTRQLWLEIKQPRIAVERQFIALRFSEFRGRRLARK